MRDRSTRVRKAEADSAVAPGLPETCSDPDPSRTFLQQFLATTGFPRALIFTPSPDGASLIPRAWRGISRAHVRSLGRPPVPLWTASTAGSCSPTDGHRCQADEFILVEEACSKLIQAPPDFPLADRPASAVALKCCGRLRGLVLLAQADPKAGPLGSISPELDSTLRLLAVYLESSSRYDRVTEQTAILRSTTRILRLIGSTLEFDEVFEALFAEIAHLVPCDSASLVLTDKDGDLHVLRSEQRSRRRDKLDRYFSQLPRQGTRVGHVLAAGEPVISADLRKQSFAEDDMLVQQGMLSVLVAPLTLQGEVIGTLNLASKAPSSYHSEHVEVLEPITSQVAIAVQHSRLMRENRLRTERLLTMNQLDRAILGARSVEEVLLALVQGIRKLIPCEGANVVLLDKHRGLLRIPRVDPAASSIDLGGGHTIDPQQSLLGEALRSRQPIHTPDLHTDERTRELDLELTARDNLRSSLVFPLIARDQPLGVLILAHSRPDAFSPQDLDLGQELADQAAVALDNALLYESNRVIAETLQSSLVSAQVPQPKGWELATFYSSATEEAQVGGDFYDFLPLPDGRLAIALGDVCGKGIAAASDTSMVKHTLRTLLYRESSAAEVLHELNRICHRHLRGGEFVTLFLGLLDQERGRIEYVSAGHPPVMGWGARGLLRLGATHNAVLGPINDQQFISASFSFDPGDLVLIYTDGLIEARNGRGPSGQFFGGNRVARCLRSASTAAGLIHTITEACLTFAGDLDDDIALIALRRLD